MASNAVLQVTLQQEAGGLLVAYDEYLHGLGLSFKTIRVYRQAIERAYTHMDLDLCNPTELAAYCQQHVPNSSSSRRHFRSALVHYWELTGRVNPPIKAVRVPKKPRPICRALTKPQASLLAVTAAGWYPQGLAVLLGLYMALRREEIASARWDRFDDDTTWYTVHGKGDVTARLPVHPTLANEIRMVRMSRTFWANKSMYLFPGCAGRDHVTPTTVWGWVHKVCDEAGIAHIQTHQLRHTAIATANDNTGNLRAVQTFARHKDPLVTAIYTRTTAAKLIEVVASIDY